MFLFTDEVHCKLEAKEAEVEDWPMTNLSILAIVLVVVGASISISFLGFTRYKKSQERSPVQRQPTASKTPQTRYSDLIQLDCDTYTPTCPRVPPPPYSEN